MVGLALFLEKRIQDGAGATSQWLLFGNGVSDSTSPLHVQDWEATVTKNNYETAIQKVINSDGFNRSEFKGKLGTHSIKKFATTKYH